MLSMLTLAFRVLPTKAEPRIWTVPVDFGTIQEAISSSEVSSGDTIYVYTGIYYESVVVNKMLTLVGESRSDTIIDGSHLGNMSALVRITTDNVHMSGFTVRNAEVGAGICVEDSQYCEIHETIVCFTGDRGIFFQGGGYNKAYDNIVHNSSAYGGIEAIWSDSNTVNNNIVYFNQWGIATNHGSYNLICNNTVYSNRGTGIHIDWPSTGNIVYNNNVTSNTNAGIAIINQANRTVISDNKISESCYGIRFEGSPGNTISGNHIMNNQVGVGLFSSENNSIYHNNFIDNTQQVQIDPFHFNIWDDGYSYGGNYWSDYRGVDSNYDGIGDTPYVIDENNQDNYPLMEPWSPLEEELVTIGTTSTIPVLDPADEYWSTWDLFNNIGEGLLKYKPGTTDLVYGIAENYTVSPDGLNYTFKLREGMHFTDGDLLDASAVKWSIDRALHLDLSPWLVSDFVDRVEVVNNLTVRFVLKRAISFFPALVATPAYFPVSSKSYPGNETADSIVGHYGPYKIKSWTKNVELDLEANPNYYGTQPKSKYVVIKFFANPSLMRQALENGDIDVAWATLTPTDIAELSANPDFKIVENHDSLVRCIHLRCNMTPFSDVRLRQAVAASIDRERICTEAYNGTVDPLYSMIPMGLWSHIDAFKDEYGVRNLTLARNLLMDAGYNEENKLQFTLWYGNRGRYPTVAAILKSELEETGMMDVTLQSANWSAFVSYIPQGIMPAFFVGWTTDYLDPNTFLTPFLHSQQSPDYGVFYNNTLMDTLLEEAMVEQNITARTELYQDVQRLETEDAPVIPFAQGTIYAVTKLNIEGVYLSPTFLSYYTIYKHVPSTRYPWSMFRHDLSHTGYSESPAPNTNQTQWTYTTGDYVFSSPAVVDGKVYVGSEDNKTYCLNALTGALIWNYTTGAPVRSSPAVVDGKVYVGSMDNKTYCLNALTGALIWNYTTGWVLSSPSVVDGKVYVGSYDKKVYCLDALTGAHIWNYTTGDYVWSSPAVVDGKVYVGSYDKKVYCLDALTGAHIWTYTTGDYVASSPAIADGMIYIGSYDGNMYCLDASTGALVWNCTIGSFIASSPTLADGKVYVGSDTDTVGFMYCLDASTGAIIWNYKTNKTILSSPAVADGMVFIGSYDHNVYAFGNVVRVTEKIQEAIDEAPAGATLIIAPGIYYESLVINKPLTLLGEKGSSPIFSGGGSGIFATLLSGASGSTVAGIVITNWDQGIFINDASNCKIYDNIMSLMGTSGIGIEGTNAVNNHIYSNIFQDNTVAINVIASSASNTIYKNIITSNNVGLSLKSGGNAIYANTISENDIGIDVTNSANNVIYHNNFANTMANALSGGLYNVWDDGYPSGGNYWSDYTGVDEKSGANQNVFGSDGIGDTQYTIAGNNDRYPLMQPFNPHDIGIINIITSKTIVGQDLTLHIDLKILNYGIYDEISTVTVYANTAVIATKTITLTKRNSTTITFTWDTKGVVKGNYIIKADVTAVPDETYLDDNTFKGSVVYVGIPGDVDGNGAVQLADLVTVAKAYGSKPGDPNWNANADVDGNTVVGLSDLVIVAKHYGQIDP